MRRKLYYSILSAVAVICAVVAVITAVYGSVFTLAGLAALPFDPIGRGLRLLSLSGAVGNGIAIAIYAALSLLPVGYYIIRLYKRNTHGEDLLLLLLSGLLFVVLYLTINPGWIAKMFDTDALIPMGKVLLGGLWWSVLTAYAILRILRRCFAADQRNLFRYFEVFLYLCAIGCAVNAFGTTLYDLYMRMAALFDANRGMEDGLLLTCIFLVIRYFGSILPYLLNIAILESAIGLFALQRTIPASADTVHAASKLAKRCGNTLTVTVLTTVCINLLQLVCAGGLRDIHGTVSVPVVSVGMVIAVLLYARFVAENRQLRADNDRLQADQDLFI